MSARASIRQSDIDRLVRAFQRAGYRPRVTIRQGEIIVEAVDSQGAATISDGAATWDRLIDRFAS